MFYSSKANKTQRVGITKVHLPSGYSWETLNNNITNDAAIIELNKDVQFSPQVRTGHCCLSFQVLPICLPSAAGGTSGNDYQEQVLVLSYKNTFLFEGRAEEPCWGECNNNGLGPGEQLD